MDSNTLERVILSALLNHSDFSRKVMPYVNPIYFSTPEGAVLSDLIVTFNEQYKGKPSRDTLEVELENKKGVAQDVYTQTKVLINTLYSDKIIEALEKVDSKWLLDKTESHFKTQSCRIAVLNSLEILEGENPKVSPEAIPKILEDALNISFDADLGHDYFEDAEERYDYYHSTDVKIPFHLTALNHITNGGAIKKSLIIPMAPTGVGKSFFMTAWAAWLIQNGYNVLYVTLEMAEEKIGERIDACLMDMALNQLVDIPRDTFRNKIDKLKTRTVGRLKIKEESSGSFNSRLLENRLDEYETKDGFVPDVVMVDYLNLANSYRVPKGLDTYLSVKYTAEEFRDTAMRRNFICCAPTQTNREGVDASDYGLGQTSESMGITHTTDFMFGLIETEEMRDNSQIRIKQLKNRWGPLTPQSFMISVNKSKMQMHDMDDLSAMNVTIPTVEPKIEEFPWNKSKPKALSF